jgi:hypothetical protein
LSYFKVKLVVDTNSSLSKTFTKYVPFSKFLPGKSSEISTVLFEYFTTVEKLYVKDFVPKVSDFFSGLLREFNLTVTGTETPNTFLVETLNYWYASGNVFDITNFTESTSVDVERVKLYKKISFRYQPSESITNKFYLQTGLKEYGNTEQPYPYDGGELNIDVPFENLMFSKYTGTNVQVGFSINSSLDMSIGNSQLHEKLP